MRGVWVHSDVNWMQIRAGYACEFPTSTRLEDPTAPHPCIRRPSHRQLPPRLPQKPPRAHRRVRLCTSRDLHERRSIPLLQNGCCPPLIYCQFTRGFNNGPGARFYCRLGLSFRISCRLGSGAPSDGVEAGQKLRVVVRDLILGLGFRI